MKLDPELQMLIRIHGLSEALHAPYRKQKNTSAAIAVVQERRAFATQGLRWHGNSATATDRVDASRSLNHCRAAGLVTTTGKTHLRIKLTSGGSLRLAALTGTRSVGQSWRMLQLAAAIEDICGFVPETFLAGKPVDDPQFWAEREWSTVEFAMSPLLIAGLVTSNASAEGTCAYFVANEGRIALNAGCPSEVWDSLPKFDEEAADLCREIFISTLKLRDEWIPEDHHEIHIPLSCGDWPSFTTKLRRIYERYKPRSEAA